MTLGTNIYHRGKQHEMGEKNDQIAWFYRENYTEKGIWGKLSRISQPKRGKQNHSGQGTKARCSWQHLPHRGREEEWNNDWQMMEPQIVKCFLWIWRKLGSHSQFWSSGCLSKSPASRPAHMHACEVTQGLCLVLTYFKADMHVDYLVGWAVEAGAGGSLCGLLEWEEATCPTLASWLCTRASSAQLSSVPHDYWGDPWVHFPMIYP